MASRLVQTIVNLLCAYLRMPYTLPSALQSPPWSSLGGRGAGQGAANLSAPHVGDSGDQASEQELEVRGAAQRILADHLFPGDDPGEVRPEHWPDVKLNLTGALLRHFDFRGCRVGNVRFGGLRAVDGVQHPDGAVFGGTTSFAAAAFEQAVVLAHARVTSDSDDHVWPTGWRVMPDGGEGNLVDAAADAAS
jgi:hypothetical protein